MKDYELREPEFINMEVAFHVNLYRNQFSINDIKSDTKDTKRWKSKA